LDGFVEFVEFVTFVVFDGFVGIGGSRFVDASRADSRIGAVGVD
jgi:hypothetical protein